MDFEHFIKQETPEEYELILPSENVDEQFDNAEFLEYIIKEEGNIWSWKSLIFLLTVLF